MSKRTKWLLGIGAIAALVFGLQVFAYADSLSGSKFEIDKPGGTSDANMVVDTAGNFDWSNVADTKTKDTGTKQTDTSYAGGEKEDDVCPSGGTGSIPNNKSDLRYFGVYQEAGPAGDPGWLHLFWTRVEEPSGATLMDFEFNKSKTDCDGAGSSPNVSRTAGDLLIEYKIEGHEDLNPDITIRRWVVPTSGTPHWGDPTLLNQGDAIGSINVSPISNPTGAADNSDGTLDDGVTAESRTFGEASIDLSAIFNANKCESFGAAMLKSRSGPPFDSALKDYIAPNTGINVQNCAQVIIRKQTDPDEASNSTSFGFTKNFATDPTSGNTFALTDDGVKDFGQTVLLGGTAANPYTVTENTIPTGWQLKGVNCAASNLGTDPDPTTTTATVSFKLDQATDVLDCTYTNEQPLGALGILKKSTKTGNPLVSTAGALFTISKGGTTVGTVRDNNTGTPAGTLTDADSTVGKVCVAGRTPGTDYTVNETSPPTGYGGASQTNVAATVVNGTNCIATGQTGSNLPTAANSATFTNDPLGEIQVQYRDLGSTETAASIVCDNSPAADPALTPKTPGEDGAADPAFDDTDETFTNLPPGTYDCRVVIDP